MPRAPTTSQNARAAALGAAIGWLFASTVATEAHGADCLEAISEANANKVFSGLAKGKRWDGCELEEVHTDRSQIEIRWKKNGRVLEPALVLPTSCVKSPSVRGQVLSTVVPPALDDA